MKRWIVLLFAVSVLLSACGSQTVIYESTDLTAPAEAEFQKIEYYRYYRAGWYELDRGSFSGAYAKIVGEELDRLAETGETVNAVSGEEFSYSDYYGQELPVEENTRWLEYDGKIYRISPDWSQICRVESHFGAGVVLEESALLKEMGSKILSYAPYDTYSGTFGNILKIKHVFAAPSDVSMIVTDMQYDSITLDVTSEIAQTLTVSISEYGQTCNGPLRGDREELTFEAGETKTVKLTFSLDGFTATTYYGVQVRAGNTRIIINVRLRDR